MPGHARPGPRSRDAHAARRRPGRRECRGDGPRGVDLDAGRRDGRAWASSRASWSCPTREAATWTATVERFAAWAPDGLGALGLAEQTGVIEEPAGPGSDHQLAGRRSGRGALAARRRARRAARSSLATASVIATPVIAAVRTDLGWRLDPDVTFLNHGSFGACPEPVLAVQRELARPPGGRAGPLPDRRAAGAARRGARRRSARSSAPTPTASPSCPNATTGVNAVLRSLRFEPGDELLTDDHEYNATINAMRAVAARDGARVVVAPIPFPIAGPDEALDGDPRRGHRRGPGSPSSATSPARPRSSCPSRELVAELDRARHRHARRRRARARAWCRSTSTRSGAAY